MTVATIPLFSKRRRCHEPGIVNAYDLLTYPSEGRARKSALWKIHTPNETLRALLAGPELHRYLSSLNRLKDPLGVPLSRLLETLFD